MSIKIVVSGHCFIYEKTIIALKIIARIRLLNAYLTEPAHEIMALFVLRKLVLQTRNHQLDV